jgi:putative intracellular protease/amidase
MNYQHWAIWTARLGLVAVLLIVGCGAVPREPASTPASSLKKLEPVTRLDGKLALFVLPERFSESEYSVPRAILEDLGAAVVVASWTSEAVLGSGGIAIQPQLVLDDACAGDYDAIVFVGGEGVKATAPETQRIVKEAVAEGKVVAAICAAQGILRAAGLVETVGADAPYVSRSGLIVTASGPIKSREFGETIAAALSE